MRWVFVLLSSFLFSALFSQVVETDPPFPTPDGQVTVLFDATQGNGALRDCNCTVYAHTGVIIEQSTSPSDWRYVVGNWGTDDSRVRMTSLGNNRYSLSYNVRQFYNFPAGERILKLAFVFRNVNGTIVGRDTDGSDIFVDVYDGQQGLLVTLHEPSGDFVTVPDEVLRVRGVASRPARMEVWRDATMLYAEDGVMEINTEIGSGAAGDHVLMLRAIDGADTASVTRNYISTGPPEIADPPSGSQLGVTRIDGRAVRWMLEAPGKQQVFIKGSFSDWQLSSAYQMKRSVDGRYFWLDISESLAEGYHSYQYLVDGSILIADPLSELVLDPGSDQFILPSPSFPDLPAYPIQKTAGVVTVFRKTESRFDWQHDNYQRPPRENLLIYELLVRDFSAAHDFDTVLDSLDYLQRLGVNVLQLMPVQEFEGNLSWGYNPSFHMALDKYYGSPDQLKALVDEAHRRGMAVVLDVVYNHAFSQSPLCQLYWDAANSRPSASNPWLNPVERHPFNVGYDFNHESQATKDWLDRVMIYWKETYHIDGFRFDLSKGFTQRQSNNVQQWGQYDAGRVALLKRIADVLWAADDEFYVILEHFADNQEEKELSDYGMMLWGNMNHAYSEAAMGFSADLRGALHSERGWTYPYLIAYMESHDEERMMYRNLQFGTSSGSYNIRQLSTALDRIELASTFFYTMPGPKMLWQFGEVGYDYSINYCENGTINESCRTSPKPVRWDYLQDADRRSVYDVTRDILHLRHAFRAFTAPQHYDHSLVDKAKRFRLSGEDLQMVALGNFDVVPAALSADFYRTGWWYEYFSGDSIQVTDTAMRITLGAGRYRLYLDKKVDRPSRTTSTAVTEVLTGENQVLLYPNPVDGSAIRILLPWGLGGRWSATVSDAQGRLKSQHVLEFDPTGSGEMLLGSEWPAGLYFLTLYQEDKLLPGRFLLIR